MEAKAMSNQKKPNSASGASFKKETLQTWDHDKDGKLDRSDLAKGLKSFGLGSFSKLEMSETDTVDLEDTEQLSTLQRKLSGLSKIRKLLERADSDREAMKERRDKAMEETIKKHQQEDIAAKASLELSANDVLLNNSQHKTDKEEMGKQVENVLEKEKSVEQKDETEDKEPVNLGIEGSSVDSISSLEETHDTSNIAQKYLNRNLESKKSSLDENSLTAKEEVITSTLTSTNPDKINTAKESNENFEDVSGTVDSLDDNKEEKKIDESQDLKLEIEKSSAEVDYKKEKESISSVSEHMTGSIKITSETIDDQKVLSNKLPIDENEQNNIAENCREAQKVPVETENSLTNSVLPDGAIDQIDLNSQKEGGKNNLEYTTEKESNHSEDLIENNTEKTRNNTDKDTEAPTSATVEETVNPATDVALPNNPSELEKEVHLGSKEAENISASIQANQAENILKENEEPVLESTAETGKSPIEASVVIEDKHKVATTNNTEKVKTCIETVSSIQEIKDTVLERKSEEVEANICTSVVNTEPNKSNEIVEISPLVRDERKSRSDNECNQANKHSQSNEIENTMKNKPFKTTSGNQIDEEMSKNSTENLNTEFVETKLARSGINRGLKENKQIDLKDGLTESLLCEKQPDGIVSSSYIPVDQVKTSIEDDRNTEIFPMSDTASKDADKVIPLDAKNKQEKLEDTPESEGNDIVYVNDHSDDVREGVEMPGSPNPSSKEKVIVVQKDLEKKMCNSARKMPNQSKNLKSGIVVQVLGQNNVSPKTFAQANNNTVNSMKVDDKLSPENKINDTVKPISDNGSFLPKCKPIVARDTNNKEKTVTKQKVKRKRQKKEEDHKLKKKHDVMGKSPRKNRTLVAKSHASVESTAGSSNYNYELTRENDFDVFGFDKKTKTDLQRMVNSILQRELQIRDEKIENMSISLEKMRNVFASHFNEPGNRGRTLRLPTVVNKSKRNKSKSKSPPRKAGNSHLPRVAGMKPSKAASRKLEQNSSKVHYDQCRSTVFCPSETKVPQAETPPKNQLLLDFVHGYSAVNTGNSNVHSLLSGEIMYPVSATVVIYDIETHKQRFFREHGEAISALALHPDKCTVASGDLAPEGSIKIWDSMDKEVSTSAKTVNIIHNFPKGVCCLDFSPDGALIAAVAKGEHHQLVIWDWKKNERLCSAKSHSAAVRGIKFNPYQFTGIEEIKDETDLFYTLITYGDRHIKFWTMSKKGASDTIGYENSESPRKRKKNKKVVNGQASITRSPELEKYQEKFSLHGSVGTLGNISKKNRHSHFTSINFLSRDGLCVAGTSKGDLNIWSQPRNESEELVREKETLIGLDGEVLDREIYFPFGKWCATVPDVHNGAIEQILYDSSSSRLLTCGRDRFIIVWSVTPREESVDDKSSCADWLKILHRIEIRPEISGGGFASSATWNSSDGEDDSNIIYLGTSSSSIIKLNLEKKEAKMILRGHFAVVEGLATHPKALTYVTTSKDCSLRLWDMSSRKMLGHCRLPERATCVDIHPDGSIATVGLESAKVMIISLESQRVSRSGMRILPVENCIHLYKKSVPKSQEEDIIHQRAKNLRRKANKTNEASKKTITTKKDIKEVRGREITNIKFSPCGRFLAAGSKDNIIHILDSKRGFKRVTICSGHSSTITNLDWSNDGKYIQSSDAGSELLYWKIFENSERVVKSKAIVSGFDLRDETWSSWSSILGWPVQGIWRGEDFDFVQVTCLHRSNNQRLLITGDDLSTLSLFNYPCLKNEENEGAARKDDASGFTEKISNVKFSLDDNYVICVGESKGSIFQWRMKS